MSVLPLSPNFAVAMALALVVATGATPAFAGERNDYGRYHGHGHGKYHRDDGNTKYIIIPEGQPDSAYRYRDETPWDRIQRERLEQRTTGQRILEHGGKFKGDSYGIYLEFDENPYPEHRPAPRRYNCYPNRYGGYSCGGW